MKFVSIVLAQIAVYALFAVAITTGFGTTDIQAIEKTPQVAGAAIEAAPLNTGNAAVDAINAARIKSGVSPLHISGQLDSVAAYRVSDMSGNNYYSHTALDGSSYIDLFTETPQFACENLDLSATVGIDQVISDWMNSPAHKYCMLHPSVTHIGIQSTEMTKLGGEVVTAMILSSN